MNSSQIHPPPTMASCSFSPAASAAAFLLLLFLSLTLPPQISSRSTLQLRRNLRSANDEEDLDSPISQSKFLLKKKLLPEIPEFKSKIKSLKTKPANSTSSSSSSAVYITNTKSKLNRTLSSPFTASNKSKLNKTLTALPSPPQIKLNKTSSAMKTNTKPFKSNSTKTQLRSPNPTPKIQKQLDKPKPHASTENWLDDTEFTGAGKDDDDLISEFRELPSRLHSALVPDLEKLSTTSKLYLSKTHREITAGVKHYVGNKYAPSIASAASTTLLVLPLLLVTALFHHLLRTGSSASLHRALLFVQAYLAIYFATLSLTAVLTGLEPLRFFYAASPSAYAWTQAAQTFGYVVYLVAQLIALVVAFSAAEGERRAGKAVGMAQMLLGLAVGMHYYITVFHRAVSGEPPRANWKVHGIYAACFIVICGLGRAERRKKAYLQGDRGDMGKKS